MATKIWDSSDGDWSVAGSWSPNGVPIVNDDVVFPKTNFQDVTAGLNQTAIDLDSITIEDGCTIDIGLSGSPLVIAADLIRHEGEGSLFLQSSATLFIDHLIVNSPNWDDAVQLEDLPVGSHLVRMSVQRGKVVASGTSSFVPFVEITYLRNLNDAYVNPTDATVQPLISNMYINGGIYEGYLPSLVFISDGVVRGTSGAGTILYQSGGIFDWRDTATISKAIIMGGTFTSRFDQRQKTITNLVIFPGAATDLGDNVIVTNGGDLLNRPITG